MTLYSFQGSEPAPLPAIFRTPDGETATHLRNRDAAELANWGFVPFEGTKPTPDEGKQVVWDEDTGTYVQQDLPPPPDPPEPQPRPISKLEAIGLVRGVSGMDDTQELAMRKDPALELLWLKWRDEVPAEIRFDAPEVPVFLNGVQAAGYLTQQQHDKLLAAWPRA